jgi:hypothetical protein
MGLPFAVRFAVRRSRGKHESSITLDRFSASHRSRPDRAAAMAAQDNANVVWQALQDKAPGDALAKTGLRVDAAVFGSDGRKSHRLSLPR